MPNVRDFYSLFCSRNFKRISETVQEGYSGMYYVLRILSESESSLCAGDISEKFGVSTARTAVMLNTLEKKGYIEKSKSDKDARRTDVKITDLGEKVLEDRKKRIFSVLEDFIGKINENEKEELYKILLKLFSE